MAFEYEKEIRFVRSRLLQNLAPPDGAVYRNVTIKGQVRNKFILPLRHYPEFGIDASLPALLDHIIIGPSSRQDDIHRDVTGLLNANDLGHVPVIPSTIPYRATR